MFETISDESEHKAAGGADDGTNQGKQGKTEELATTLPLKPENRNDRTRTAPYQMPARKASLLSEAKKPMTTPTMPQNARFHQEALTSEFHQSRQTAITSELLDIISGFEALKGKEY